MKELTREMILTQGGAVFRLRCEVARAETLLRHAQRELRWAKHRLRRAETEAARRSANE
jgi:hypothetical protein